MKIISFFLSLTFFVSCVSKTNDSYYKINEYNMWKFIHLEKPDLDLCFKILKSGSLDFYQQKAISNHILEVHASKLIHLSDLKTIYENVEYAKLDNVIGGIGPIEAIPNKGDNVLSLSLGANELVMIGIQIDKELSEHDTHRIENGQFPVGVYRILKIKFVKVGAND